MIKASFTIHVSVKSFVFFIYNMYLLLLLLYISPSVIETARHVLRHSDKSKMLSIILFYYIYIFLYLIIFQLSPK